MTRLWRIVKRNRVDEAFTGHGSHLFGGRWNSPGRAVVYSSQSLSLAVLELLVHVEDVAALASFVYFVVTLEEDQVVENLDLTLLPPNWPRPEPPPALRHIGDQWFDSGRSLGLRVPSAIIDGEFNILLNPIHRLFSYLKIDGPFDLKLDTRLSRGLGLE